VEEEKKKEGLGKKRCKEQGLELWILLPLLPSGGITSVIHHTQP
jgi:hypothetical protein